MISSTYGVKHGREICHKILNVVVVDNSDMPKKFLPSMFTSYSLLSRNFATPDMNSWRILLVRSVYLIPDDNAAEL
jgi:hypothetical protein